MYATVEKWGAIHVVVPCAGVGWPIMTLTSKGPFNSEIFKRVIDINVYGSIHVAKYAAVIMSKNKPDERGERGVMVFVSSAAAEEGQRG